MPFNVMRRFMHHNKGDFVAIAGILDEWHRERDDRPPATIERLEGVRHLIRPVVHDDLKVAVPVWAALLTQPFYHRFNPGHRKIKIRDCLSLRQLCRSGCGLHDRHFARRLHQDGRTCCECQNKCKTERTHEPALPRGLLC